MSRPYSSGASVRSGSSGGSLRSANSGFSRRSAGGSSEYEPTKGSIKALRKMIEEGLFGVLSILVENGKSGRIIPYLSILIDFLSTLGFCFASHFPYGRSTISSLSNALQFVQFKADAYLGNEYNSFLIVFWTAVALVVISSFCVYFVGKMFWNGKITHIAPIRFLRLFVGMLLSVFFVQMLNVLMIPLACTYSRGTLDAFPTLGCWSTINAVHSIIALLAIVILGAFAVVVASVYFDPTPNTRPVEPLCAPHSYLDMVFLVSRAGLAMTGRFLRTYTVLSSILIFVLNLAVFGSHIFWLPYFSLLTNRLKSMSFSIILWASIILMVVCNRNDPSNDILTYVFIAGTPLFAVGGYFLPALRLRTVDGRKLDRHSSSSSFRNLKDQIKNKKAADPLLKVKFHSDTEVELSTRFLQQIEDPTDDDLMLARRIFVSGLRAYPQSTFLVLAFASFLQHVANDKKHAIRLTEYAANMHPRLTFRFLILRQRKEMEKRTEEGEMDLISSVDFSKNYTAARNFHRTCVSSMQELWRTLLPSKVMLKKIPALLDHILKNEARAAFHFDYLMYKYRSPRVLRAFSSFQSDVKNNFSYARNLLLQADDMESHVRKSFNRGGSRTKEIDGFDFEELVADEPGDSAAAAASAIVSPQGFALEEAPKTGQKPQEEPSATPAVKKEKNNRLSLPVVEETIVHSPIFSAIAPTCFTLQITESGHIVSCPSSLSSIIGFESSSRSTGQDFAGLFFTEQSQELFADALSAARYPFVADDLSCDEPMNEIEAEADEELDPEEDLDEMVLDEKLQFVKRLAASSSESLMKKVKFPVVRGFLLGKCAGPKPSLMSPSKTPNLVALKTASFSSSPMAPQYVPYYYVMFLSQFGHLKLYLFPAESKPAGSILLDQNQAVCEFAAAIPPSPPLDLQSFLIAVFYTFIGNCAAFADNQFCQALSIQRADLIGAQGDIFLPAAGSDHVPSVADYDNAIRIGQYIVTFAIEERAISCIMDASSAGPSMVALSMTTLTAPEPRLAEDRDKPEGSLADNDDNRSNDGRGRPPSIGHGSMHSGHSGHHSASIASGTGRSGGRRRRRSSASTSVLLQKDNQKSTTVLLHRNILMAVIITILFIVASYLSSHFLAARTSQLISALDQAGTVSQYGVRLASRARTMQLDYFRSDLANLKVDLKALNTRISVFGNTFTTVYNLGEQQNYGPLHDLYYRSDIDVNELDGTEQVISNTYGLFELGRMYMLQAMELQSSANNIIAGTATFNSSLAKPSLRAALYFITESGPNQIKDSMYQLLLLYGDFASSYLASWKTIQSSMQSLAICVLFGLVFVVKKSLKLTHNDRLEAIICLLRIPKDAIPEILERQYNIIEEERLEDEMDFPEEAEPIAARTPKPSSIKKTKPDTPKHANHSKISFNGQLARFPSLTLRSNSNSNMDKPKTSALPSPPPPAIKVNAPPADIEVKVSQQDDSSDPTPLYKHKKKPSGFLSSLMFWTKKKSKSKKDDNSRSFKKKCIGQLSHEDIDRKLSSQLQSDQVRRYITRYFVAVFVVGALLVLALTLGINSVTKIEEITNEIEVSHYRSLMVITMRNLAQELMTRPASLRASFRQQLADTARAAMDAHEDLVYGNPSRGITGNAFRYPPLERWMYDSMCHRAIASNCVNSTDPYYSRLYSPLSTLTMYYLQTGQRISQLADADLSMNNEYFKFVWIYPYDNVMDGLERAAAITVQESQSILEKSSSDQLSIMLSMLAIMIVLYLGIFKPMVATVKYESERTTSILLMVPEKIVDGVEEIANFIQSKIAELN